MERRVKINLTRQLDGYNNAARRSPWLVLRDMDTDAECAPLLLKALLPDPASHMHFRIVVRAIESWLIADREEISRFLSIPIEHAPRDPDQLEDPKNTLVNLARKSRSRRIREDMVPRPDGHVKIGPAYTSRIIEYAESYWRPHEAAKHSDSLRRCVACLRRLAG